METKEKMDTDSIVAKPEYAASEFSTEAPPAYKLQSTNSVKIAKIISFTILLSSIILGSFLLASTYLQAKATCDQVSALDAVLEKELMLEAMQQDLPRPEALQTREVTNNNVVQDLSKDEMNKPNKKDETNPDDVEAINTENDIDSNDDDSLKKIRVKLPLDFDLTELAHNLLMNNQKSRMNCVVERRQTEEMNENPMKAMNPFSAFLGEEQPKEKITGERVSIFCETGAPKEQEPVVHVRRIIMPFPFGGPGPMHRFGPQMPPQNQPPFPMPQFQPQNQLNFPPQNQLNFPQQNQINFPPQNQINFPPQMRIPFQQPQMPFHPPQNMPMPHHQQQEEFPPIPAQMMSPPRPEIPQFRLINPAQPQQNQLPNFERPNFDRPNFDRPNFERPNFERPQQPENEMIPQPEVRIQLRRIQVPGPISDIFPFLNNLNNMNNMNNEKDIETRPNVQVQQVPLAVALSKVGITPDDLRNIQRMAEEKFQQHIRELVAADDDDSSGDSDSNQSDEEEEVTKPEIVQEEKSSEEKKQEPAQEDKNEDAPQILALGRSNFGRSLNPIQLPIRPEIQEAERADFVQPR